MARLKTTIKLLKVSYGIGFQKKILQLDRHWSIICSYILNDGASRLIDVFNLIEIKPGTFCEHYCIQRKMDQKSSDSNKQRRKQLRAIQKGFADTAEEQEGLVYGAGLL